MKTPKTKKSNNLKKLKFNPQKNDLQRDWNIEKIVNDRVTLKVAKQQKNQENFIGEKPVIDYVSRKQYEIAWQQNCPKGYWPNTWQPQENIPDYTRLDYLLRKKSLLRISKKRSRFERMKSKQSFKQHLQFTMKNISKKSEIFAPLNVRKENIKKILEKKENQKLPKKEENTQKYKNWSISYNSKSQAFEQLIERFMKGQKNPQYQEMVKQEKSKTVKLPFTKQEFFDSFTTEKKQPLKLKTEQNSSIARTSTEQETYHQQFRSTHHSLPFESTNKFIKDIEYIGNQNYVDYFRLELFDDSISYVSEEDLVKYLPFAYQMFLEKAIHQSIDDAITQLQGLNQKENFTHKKCVENLSGKIGLKKSDFDFTNEDNDLFNPKRAISKFSDMSDTFGIRPYSIENDEESPEQIQFQRLNMEQNNLQTKKKGINSYFNFIKRLNSQFFTIMQQQKMNNQQGNYSNKKSEQIILFESTRCKELFKNHLLKQNRKGLSSKTPQISTLDQIQKISKSQKRIEKSPQKKIKTQTIPTNNLKISTQSRKITIKKAQQQNKTKETTQISNQEKSLLNSNLERLRIMNNDNQIYEILKVMQKPSNPEDNFYDSDDERN